VGGSGGGIGGEHALGFEVFDRSESSASGIGGDNDKKSPTPQVALDHHLGEMEGTLWTRLAEYHVRAGDFEVARSVYEEALDAITRVRDFSLVFDAYVKFEEGVIEALMELMEDEEEAEGDEEGEDEDKNERQKNESAAVDNEDLDILLGDSTAISFTDGENAGSSVDVDLAISRAEHLTSRRPLLLNRVLLRQNPHNIGEWIKRSQLYLDLEEVDMAAAALEESLKSVSAHKAVNGSPCTLVMTLIDILENRQKNVDAARKVFERICTNGEYDFQDADDLAQCHASWVELELRQENWDMALNLARRAVAGNVGRKGTKAARGLSRSLRLWNLLFDLEESLGTVQTTKDAYDRALEIKVATPSHVLNYAAFLKEKKYFEESFAAYERGIGLFPFPHAGATLLWKSYITDFLERYNGSKTPRARELFDRCIANCPSEESPEFFLLYGNYEETHGLTKRALGVYERMCNTVPAAEKYTAYRLYIAKAIQYLGVPSARPIYEAAISALDDGPASRICLEYAKMETGLREVDRARTVLVYGAQLADPRRDPDYWKAWHEFEVSYGNEETFREMLRVKRSVQAAFSTVNYNAAEMGAGIPQVETLSDDAALEMIAEREGVVVEKKPLVGGFVQSKKRTADMADLSEVERRAARLREATAAVASNGGDEIDIDEEEEEEDPESALPVAKYVQGVSEKTIPAAVFGGLTATGN
jgi:pre-mRNA-splicing factor SYF1